MNGGRADQQRRGGAKEEERVRRASSEGGGEQEQGGRARDGIAASRVQATGGRPQGGYRTYRSPPPPGPRTPRAVGSRW